MALVIGENATTGSESKNTRYVVTVTNGGKTVYTSVGMLFKSADAAEKSYVRVLTNHGVTLPKGSKVEAKAVPAR